MRHAFALPAALASCLLLGAGPAEAGLLEMLFGPSPRAVRVPLQEPGPGYDTQPAARATPRAGGGSRALCVRMCDGYYYPLDGVATRGGSGVGDCENSCPGVAMGLYRTSGDAVAEARDASGRRYGDLETAFSYRRSVSPSCSCHREAAAGSGAILGDMTLRTGDIVVTASGAVVFRGSDRDAHAGTDFEDIRASRALPRNAFAQADRLLGFSFQESQARKAAVQLARTPAQDIVVTPLRTGTIAPGLRTASQATTAAAAGEAGGAPAARVILPMTLSSPN